MNRKIFFACSICILFLVNFRSLAQSNFEFVENRGQWQNNVFFRGDFYSGSFYLERNGFTVNLHHADDLKAFFGSHHHEVKPAVQVEIPKAIEPGKNPNGEKPREIIRSHAYAVRFEGASTNVEIYAEKPFDTYNNYFLGNDPSKWATGVKLYQVVNYKNIYPGIDIRYYSEGSQLKYDFIVHPGADLSVISIQYLGVDYLKIKNKDLIIGTSVGETAELSPYSYQVTDKGRTEVKVQYEIKSGNRVKLKAGNYDKTRVLIIDPSLIFSSFTGSAASNYGFTATPGPDGSLFAGGIVFGDGFPVTVGAYQSNFGGGVGANSGTDIGIMKFSPTGNQRLYATYIGGNRNEYPHSMYCDPNGNLVILGRSYSSDYPTTAVIGTAANSTSNIVITKLNSTGSALIGSIKIGGSGDDGYNVSDMQATGSYNNTSVLRFYGDDSRSEVVLDENNFIYVVAQTKSGDFPVTAGAIQSNLRGNQDGVVMKINPDCTNLIWATYLGGSSNDGVFNIAIQPGTGDIYVSGATESSDFPGDKTGAYGQNNFGAIDGFVAIISNDGSTLKKSSYFGTSSIDVIYGIQMDLNGYPYIMGISHGSWPEVNNPYKNPNSKQFVAKLEKDLSGFIFSTVFGSGSANPNMSPVAFMVDRCENLYISGWGGNLGQDYAFQLDGVNGMPITSDAIKSITDNRDFYFIVLEKNVNNILWGSFFGQNGGLGEHVDGGTSRFDPNGYIYMSICANCNSPGINFPTTPGVVGPVNGAAPNGCNLAAIKIHMNFSGVSGTVQALVNGVPKTAGCAPFTVDFRDEVRIARSYIWDFGDGTPRLNTTERDVTHTFVNPGSYEVMMIAIDSNTCNVSDTSYITITVSDNPANISFDYEKLLPCEDLSYRFINNSTAGMPFEPNSFTWDFGDGTRITNSNVGTVTHTFPGPGTYNVRLILNDPKFCNGTDSITVELRVSPITEARFEVPVDGCVPFEAAFNNTSLGGQTYLWDFGDGTTSTEAYPVHIYNTPGTYQVRLTVTDPNTCNITDDTTVTVRVHPLPVADFSVSPVPPERNVPAIFTNLSTGAVRYQWHMGDGTVIDRNNADTLKYQFNQTGTYEVCLVAFNEFGCQSMICKTVEAIVDPLLDVPNAFTPGKFGQNSVIKVNGFGIATMSWKIYNRWGQMVFESNHPSIGWDGTYKGEVQPMDVYTYTLEVQFTDGRKLRRTGDITLIR